MTSGREAGAGTSTHNNGGVEAGDGDVPNVGGRGGRAGTSTYINDGVEAGDVDDRPTSGNDARARPLRQNNGRVEAGNVGAPFDSVRCAVAGSSRHANDNADYVTHGDSATRPAFSGAQSSRTPKKKYKKKNAQPQSRRRTKKHAPRSERVRFWLILAFDIELRCCFCY